VGWGQNGNLGIWVAGGEWVRWRMAGDGVAVVGWCLEWFLEDEGRRRGFRTKREIGVFGWLAVSWYGGERPEVVSRWWRR
jgi:hypothetical protein